MAKEHKLARESRRIVLAGCRAVPSPHEPQPSPASAAKDAVWELLIAAGGSWSILQTTSLGTTRRVAMGTYWCSLDRQEQGLRL